MKRYFFDADGVLFCYERHAYTGLKPLYIQPNRHYFRTVMPDTKILSLIQKLNLCKKSSDEIYILTSVPNNELTLKEHRSDKKFSFAKWYPLIKPCNIIISVIPKPDAARYTIGTHLSVHDILIDDYNKNLNEWQSAGGTSIKYCNGINTPATFSGTKINKHTDSVNHMLDILLNAK